MDAAQIAVYIGQSGGVKTALIVENEYEGNRDYYTARNPGSQWNRALKKERVLKVIENEEEAEKLVGLREQFGKRVRELRMAAYEAAAKEVYGEVLPEAVPGIIGKMAKKLGMVKEEPVAEGGDGGDGGEDDGFLKE